MLFLHPNSSTSNLESDPEKNQVPLKSINRARAGTITKKKINSQPIGRDAIIATSGAATALSPETVVYLHAHLHH